MAVLLPIVLILFAPFICQGFTTVEDVSYPLPNLPSCPVQANSYFVRDPFQKNAYDKQTYWIHEMNGINTQVLKAAASDALENAGTTKKYPLDNTSVLQNNESIGSVVIALLVSISLATLAWSIGRTFAKRKQSDQNDIRIEAPPEAPPPSSTHLSPSPEQLIELYDLIKANNPLFLTKFCSYYPRYIDRLNRFAFPELISSELEICAYLKLNLDTKEISRYTHRSVRSIENRRYRIRKKLNLSPDTDLKNFLLNVD